jgi:hypothetical protein
MALFDVRFTDTDAASHVARPVQSTLAKAENEKKTKHGDACEQRHASFTPLVISVDGALGRESKAFLNRLSNQLAHKWERSFSEATTWVKAKLRFGCPPRDRPLYTRDKDALEKSRRRGWCLPPACTGLKSFPRRYILFFLSIFCRVTGHIFFAVSK